MEAKEQIKEINQHISDALEQWANIMLTADADKWAYHLSYNERDALNAVMIVNHVLQNIGIKSGHINEANVFQKGVYFRRAIKDFSGLDTLELVKKVTEDKVNGSKS